MSVELAVILSTIAYKLASLAVGTIFCVLGYRLFARGVWGHAGELSANIRNNKLLLKSAAPGTFFTTFGALIVVATIWQGLGFNYRSPVGDAELHTAGSAFVAPVAQPPASGTIVSADCSRMAQPSTLRASDAGSVADVSNDC